MGIIIVIKIKRQFSLHRWQNFSLSNLATLRNEKKLAAVSRERPESTKNTQSRNTIDPEMAQEYISQLSEEIEGRVTKKLSKEFSRTESRILGALSKLDDFLLNPQVRTCSVAVPGTSRNSNSENREPTGDRSLDDPCPEVRYPSHHSGNLNSPEVEDYPHRSNLQSCCFISVQRWKHNLQTKRVIGEAISFSTELFGSSAGFSSSRFILPWSSYSCSSRLSAWISTHTNSLFVPAKLRWNFFSR